MYSYTIHMYGLQDHFGWSFTLKRTAALYTSFLKIISKLLDRGPAPAEPKATAIYRDMQDGQDEGIQAKAFTLFDSCFILLILFIPVNNAFNAQEKAI